MEAPPRDLYLSMPPETFSGVSRPRVEALFSILGVPFDSTASYRPGQRFAPREIRRSSMELESNGLYVEGDIDSVPLADEGDVAAVPGSAHLTLERVERVVEDLASEGRIPVVLGGDHLVTLGVLRGLARSGVRPCIAVLDAHFDLRREYLGERYSHATVFRRVLDELSLKVFYIGVRAYSQEELSVARESRHVDFVTAARFEILGIDASIVALRKFAVGCTHLYISIDMDFYDPAFAPGVGNPEPAGLTAREGLKLVSRLALPGFNLAGIDIVEVAPPYDPSGVTSLLAAKTLQDLILAWWNQLSSQRPLHAR